MVRLKGILEGVLVAVMLMTACLGARCEVVCSLPHGCGHRQQVSTNGCGMAGMVAALPRVAKVAAAQAACPGAAARLDADVRSQRQQMDAVSTTAVAMTTVAALPMPGHERVPPDSAVHAVRPLERSSALRI